MTLRRVLVIFKKSALQIYVRERREAHIERLVRRGHEAVSHMRLVDAEQARADRQVARTLERLGIHGTFRWRAERFRTDGFDMVITVGGDGTLLEASHHVGSVPVLGVNSSPTTSVGYFSIATPATLGSRLREVMSGRLRAVPLQRLQAAINGRPIPVPVLNDVLFCNENPAATSRYILRVGGAREEQKSSGIWISTSAGSTAALRAAGGRVLPVRSRKIAYVVRELYSGPGERPRLSRGAVAPDVPMSIVTKMRKSSLYVDGSHLVFPLRLGDRVDLSPHPVPLRLVGFRRRT